MKKVFLVFLILPMVIFAAEIAYVDAMQVFQNVNEFKVEYEGLMNFFTERQANIDEQKGKIENELKVLQEQSELMDRKRREQKSEELQEKYNKLMVDFQQAQTELNQKQQILMERFQQRLVVSVQSVANKEGYDMVLLKEAVVFANVGNDITSLVIREMNAISKAPAKKTETPKKKK